jgi:hypothetical protein
MNGPKVGDVLRRKMFAPKQYTRKDAVGLMASSPELVQAVQRRNLGGINISDMAQQPAVLDDGMTAESLMILAGGRNSPRVSTDTVEENITSSASPSKDPGYRTTADAESGRIPPAVSATASTTTTLPAVQTQSMEQILKSLQTNKTAAQFIDENKAMLEKYAPIPKAKRLSKDYLTKYFLDVAAAGAAGQDIVPALAGQAPKNFEDYLAGKKEEEKSDYERNLLALTMGITDKKAQDAANQALNLKILEIQGDQPEKIKQINALAKQMMDRDPNLTLTEATKKAQDVVFEPNQGKVSMLAYQGMKDLGFSDQIAGILAAPSTSQLFTDPTQALGALQRFAGTDVLSETDIRYLGNAAGLDAEQIAAVLRGEPVPSRQT